MARTEITSVKDLLFVVGAAVGAPTGSSAALNTSEHNPEGKVVEMGQADLAGTSFSPEARDALTELPDGNFELNLSSLNQPTVQGSSQIDKYVESMYPNLAATVLRDNGTLTHAARGEDVREVQVLLNSLGLSQPISADGAWGSKTQRAFDNFEKGYKEYVRVDGVLDANDLRVLCAASGRSKSIEEAKPTINEGLRSLLERGETLSAGSKNSQAVTELQKLLRDNINEKLKVDGDFGGRTEYALAIYQLWCGLPATSILDIPTYNALVAPKVKVPMDPKGLSRCEVLGYREGKEFGFTAANIGGHILKYDAAASFIEMSEAALYDGHFLQISSAFRTMEHQQREYKLYKSGYGPEAAVPGYSKHQSGLAVDIEVGGSGTAAHKWLVKHAAEFGFYFTVKSEHWHLEYKGRGS